MSVETNPEEYMSLMHLDQLQEMRQQSVIRKKRLKVVVEFAPFNFSSRMEFGQEERDYAEDGNSFKAQKYVDVLEWMYAPPKSRVSKKTGKPNKLIYVNCSSLTGGDLLSFFIGNQEATTRVNKEKVFRDSALMQKVEFAVRQLKDYLENLENTDDFKEIYNCGSVKLYISAYSPVDILVFAFQKALGFSVEDKIREEGLALQNEGVKADEVYRYDLYGGLIDKVKNNANIKFMAQWFKEHCWSFHVESCEVHQVYNMNGTFLTEQGKYKKKAKEIMNLESILNQPTQDFVKAYKEGKGIFTDDFSQYESVLNSWKSQKKPTVYEERTVEERRRGGEIVDSTYCKMEFPAIDYDGKNYSLYGLRDILSKEAKTYYDKRAKANSRSELEKRAKANLEQIDKEEEAYNASSEKQRAELQKKRETLQKRRVQDSPEQKAWQRQYDESHAVSTQDSLKEREVIEYQGEMLNELQLLEKEISILKKDIEKSKKFCERRKQAYELLKQLEKVKWDMVWTCVQVAAALTCLILTVVLPPAGVLVATVLCSTVSIGCECVKWATDDNWKENWKSHSLSIFLDAVAIAFIPLLSAMSKTTGLVQATHNTGHLLEAGVKGGEAVGAVAKTAEGGSAAAKAVEGGSAAAKAGEGANAAAKTGEGANAAAKTGEGANAADDVVVTVKELEDAAGVENTVQGGARYSNGVEELARMRKTGQGTTTEIPRAKGGVLENTASDAQKWTKETGEIINQPVDTSKATPRTPKKNVSEIERRMFSVSPEAYEELTKMPLSNATKVGPQSADYFARLSRLQQFINNGKYTSLLNKGYSKAVVFTGKDLYNPHLFRLMNMFGFGEAFTLLKTARLLDVTVPTWTYVSRAYILFNSWATYQRVSSIANGVYCVFDRDFNSEFANKVDQQYLMEMRDRIAEGGND